MLINDRTTGAGDCVIVTGGLTSRFEPLVYRTKADALRYVDELRRVEKSQRDLPGLDVVIEDRWWSEMNPAMRRESYSPEYSK